jgi:serine phosphatase RsbU (regulator of sigma subunit)/anti-sigma regulatory factor (Ser/Thr protein kinase)
VVDAMRSLEPIFLESRSAIVDRYPNLATAFDDLADGALAVAPLVVGDRSVAALAFAWRDAQSFEAERRQFVETLARQCAQALDRARKHESERQIAETLQRSMLPDRLPDVPGVELAARYVPGTAGMEIGGDWYDAIPLDNGRLGLAVGDVVGKGVRAASTMGQLRIALRAFALELLRPATAGSRLIALTDTFADVPFATLVYLTLDPTRRVCRYTVAGHLPPLKLGPDGTVERLDGGRSLPLGVGPDVEFEQAAIELEPGSTIVLYTDGLVERPGRSLADGLARLERSLQGEEAAALDPGALADSVLATLLAEGDPRDDVALLVVKLAPALEDLSLTLHADPSALVDLRSELRSWLDRTGASRPQAQDILLACWEACANAIEHGSNGSGEIRVELSVDSGVVNVRVADTGSWRRPVERQGRGFGLRLLRRLMDTVRVEPLPTGTVVRMARTIRAG